MNREKMEKFRKILLEKKKQILDRYFKQEETMKKLTDEGLTIPEDLEDYARIDYTETVLGELEDIEIEIIRKIDESLQMMREGRYGICEVCGKEIEEDRLEAVPWTTLCKEHAEEAEKNLDLTDRRYSEYFDRITPKEPPSSPEEHEL
ncbi:MAG TPA: molecular chaperone DnaK [Persephonella sp.]|uniref:Transcriptional regulator, TraR/DksA family n=1 Tax=Persephonella marina (strain DSM 14350 / EX-H1) TaxID=123214 RepID=C0QRG0_PERMH|nr:MULTISPECIES: TraR/DksA family transcriptional regulator [Persephonella]ACO04388.1 transcriptional regulator, TraR/DksA family [Persephonella marina EX-H1]HCB69002.1 molecular chaperone DnaK [Persephonella sp.]